MASASGSGSSSATRGGGVGVQVGGDDVPDPAFGVDSVANLQRALAADGVHVRVSFVCRVCHHQSANDLASASLASRPASSMQATPASTSASK